MRATAILAFLGGLLLAVRVMFFGVQRRLAEDRLAHSRWPLALAAFLVASGATLYMAATEPRVTAGRLALVVLLGVLAGLCAWWFVQRSAAAPSSDPEDDPRYRFQGHVARVLEPIGSGSDGRVGRVAFEFDGRTHDFRAKWTIESSTQPGSGLAGSAGSPGSEVVIERVEDDVAYVEPWTVVEQRL
jgi:membrane protein implicated in regulation of membrane protease activity